MSTFGGIARFELKYQLRNPVFWISFALFFLFAFASVAIDQISVGDSSNVHRNAPWLLAQKHFVFSIFYMFVATAFVAGVVVRDDETGYGPILRATPVRKVDYLYGRFAGALVAAIAAFAAVPLGLMLGAAMPWLDPETLGPFRPGDYAYAYFVLTVPTIALISAAFFALATATRSMLATYVGAVAFLVLWTIASTLADKPELDHVTALLEPFGMSAYQLATKYWTAAERNHLGAPLTGYLLYNRLLWGGVSVVLAAIAYPTYRFAERARTSKADRAGSEERPAAPALGSTRVVPSFGARALRAQLALRTRFEARQIITSPAFFVLLVLGVVNAIGSLLYASAWYGGEIYPVTRVMIGTLRGSFTFMPFLVAVYYAGELVWRERDRGTQDVIDATPVPDVGIAAPKFLGAALVMVAMVAVSALAAMVLQLGKGYTHLEPGKYLLWYVLPESIDAVLFAVLAIFVQTLTPNKVAGWGALVGWLVLMIILRRAGYAHDLYHFDNGPAVPLSDMNGQGTFGMQRDWFRLYWAEFSLLLVIVSTMVWRRGSQSRLRARLSRLPARMRGTGGIAFAAVLASFVATGAFLYVNTNVWNTYRSAQDTEQLQAETEKALVPFESVVQPRVTAVTLDVDIEPDVPRLTTKGSYTVVNRSAAPIDHLHLRFARELPIVDVRIPGATLESDLARFNYRIYRIDPPLAPGASTTVGFTTVLFQRGIRDSDALGKVVANGTFVNSFDIAPQLGMDHQVALDDRAKRRKYGLPPERRLPALEDESARAFNYLRKDSDWVTADITVHTAASQTPIAPGYEVSDVTDAASGRRTARFQTDAPILHFFSIQSADYAVREEAYKGIDLSIYYDRKHAFNVERMLAAMKVSLDYDQANFSPYQFHQLRILEFPDYARFAQSFANTVPYSEGIGFIADFRDEEKIDLVTYVTAHEIGHQWWAHQIIGANMQGETVLSETLAQYSALMVMERMYGREQIRKFLHFELDTYLTARGGDVLEEVPLLRVEDQGYIHYRKGSLVMYRLKSVVGEEPINRALRRLLATYAFKGPPYPTSRDLLTLLREEVGPDPARQALLTDLFEKIVVYDVKTTKVTSTPRTDGHFDVALTVEAQKMEVDGHGVETQVPLDEDVDVGVFTAEPGKKEFSAASVLALEPRRLHSGEQELRFVVDRAPTYGGADPYNVLIDRNSGDNAIAVGK